MFGRTHYAAGRASCHKLLLESFLEMSVPSNTLTIASTMKLCFFLSYGGQTAVALHKIMYLLGRSGVADPGLRDARKMLMLKIIQIFIVGTICVLNILILLYI